MTAAANRDARGVARARLSWGRMASVFALVAATRESAARWRVLAIACLAHVLHDGCTDMLYLLLPFWQRELALSLTAVGVLKTLYSGAMAVFQVPGGTAGRALGRAPATCRGHADDRLGVYALHWSASPWVLGLLLVAGGLGASVQHPLSSTLVTQEYAGPALRPTLGTYNFAGDVGKVAIPGLVALSILHVGWQGATAIVGVFGVAVAAVLFASLSPIRAGAAPAARAAVVHRLALAEPARRGHLRRCR